MLGKNVINFQGRIEYVVPFLRQETYGNFVRFSDASERFFFINLFLLFNIGSLNRFKNEEKKIV